MEHLRYATRTVDLGSVLIAANPKGLCSIEIGDSEKELLDGLRGRFPQARLESGDAELNNWVGKVLAFIKRPEGPLNLPLDVQGTVFQRLVWQALRNIPMGHTLSYSELAKAIGKPAATRAVASACASNTLAVVIPCHRVVRSDGSLSGYRWGIERKAELLRRESVEQKDKA